MKFNWPFSKATRKSTQITTLEQLIDLLNLGGVSANKLSEATYFACLKVLGESIGKLPLKLLQHKGQGVEALRSHTLYNVVGCRPNPFMTATHFWSTIEYNRNHYGNGYALITGAGSNTQLWILPSNDVKPIIDDKSLWGQKGTLWYAYTNPKTGEVYPFRYDSILHFKTSTSFDGVTGLSVREILATTLDGNMTAQNMLNKAYKNGFTGKVVLQYTGALSDDNEKAYAKRIEDFVKNAGDERTIIPMMLGTQLQPLNTKLADNEFLGLKKYSALQIAAAFGIKPNQINDYEKSSYASAEAQNLAFYVDTLLYIIKQYEEELKAKLLTDKEIKDGCFFKFNVAVILRADLKTQIESIVSAVSNGVYTPDEGRALLDYPAKGCDELMCNGSNIPVRLIGKQYEKGGENGEK